MNLEPLRPQYDLLKESVSTEKAVAVIGSHLPQFVIDNNSMSRYLAEITSALYYPHHVWKDVFNFILRGPVGDKGIRLFVRENPTDTKSEWVVQIRNSNNILPETYFIEWRGAYNPDSKVAEASEQIYFHAIDAYALYIDNDGIKPSRINNLEKAQEYMSGHQIKSTSNIYIENGVARFHYEDKNQQQVVQYEEDFELPISLRPTL